MTTNKYYHKHYIYYHNTSISTGKEWESETGTYYFGARRYDPTIGMWLGMDPVRQFSSPYVYAGNGFNSLIGIDPDGKKKIRAAIYYNATNGGANNNVSFDAKEYAKSYKDQLESLMPDDEIEVAVFSSGEFMDMQSWLNIGGDNDDILRGIMAHGGRGLSHISDIPYSEFENRITFYDLNRFLFPTFISACWANSNIDQTKYQNLIKPDKDGTIEVMKWLRI